MTKPTIKDFLNGEIKFDPNGSGYFWIVKPDGNHEMLADMRIRGWGEIKNLFRSKAGLIDAEAAGNFQDDIGEFIAAAINEKIERDFK